MTIDIRTASGDDEIAAAHRIFRTAMVGLATLPAPREPLNEPGRTLLARLDGETVGAATSYTSWLAVPGGARVPHAAVTQVGVLPTHARRGVLTALLRRQLAEIAARGEVVAGLRATQGGIYERFGYAVASSSARVELDTVRARLRETVPASGPVRFLDPDRAVQTCAEIYAAAELSRAGAVDRPQYWWRFRELAHGAEGHTVAHGEAGREDGFARYRAFDTADWPRSARRSVIVDDLVAATPAALLGLIRHLLAADIVDRVIFAAVAPDFPLRHLLVDERAVTVSSVRDETWLRLVDVRAALERRTYRAADAVTLAVTDPLRPENTGTYRVSADGVAIVDEPADLALDVAALAAVYLGGASWRDLALAGRVTPARPGALDAADELFATPTPPFSGTWF